nr:sigma-E factor negative regulatory protein [uncultured Steroidobacter sp.]
MTDALNEQLSACLDGELPPAELDLLLKRVERGAELRAAIGRYSLIGEAMRAERPAVASPDFASRVMAAVAAEPARSEAPVPVVQPNVARQAATAHTSRISPHAVRYLRPAAGMAIAAGVAAVAVFTMQPMGQSDLAPVGAPLIATNQPAANEPVITSDPGSSYVVPTSTSRSAFIPATRLTNYVVAHSEYSSPLGRRSVLSGVLADDAEAQALESGEAEIKISIGDDGAPER